MDQVDAVVEDVAPLGRGQGHPGQLAVDGVEEGHDPGADQAPAEVAGPEQAEGRQHQQEAEGHLVRRHLGQGAPAGDDPGRRRPDVLGDEVGDALVRALEQALLDRADGSGVRRSSTGGSRLRRALL
jgi:hypothetical protein